MITKITCRYSFEVLDFHCNDFGFTFNIGVSYLGVYKTSMDRRWSRRMTMFYKILNGMAPSYLLDHVPDHISSNVSFRRNDIRPFPGQTGTTIRVCFSDLRDHRFNHNFIVRIPLVFAALTMKLQFISSYSVLAIAVLELLILTKYLRF